ncbi:hypothetical protein C7212DRAFT_347342 [Tuber magnatum]|uniref:Uncharacterized protein n=1 Tax=Tuber magnatum TaxID=42249 RepID=A0A317SHC9_9PEZI|nr:hypothetical protein C7212DRAFT_347342 [Tuber magnatum]
MLPFTIATTVAPYFTRTFRQIMTYDVPTLPSHLTPAPGTPSALPVTTGSLGYTGTFQVHGRTNLTVTEVYLSIFTSVTVVEPSVPSNGLEYLDTILGLSKLP